MAMDPTRRVWRPAWPCPVESILSQQRHGAGDPTMRRDADGRLWRASRTPLGPVTLALSTRPELGEVHAEAWGAGSDWALEQLPDLLGASDSWEGFEPQHPVLEDAWRRHPHARLGRSGLIFDSLVPAIIEQKVTGQEAFAGFRRMVLRYGEPAPGPGAAMGLRLQPEPARIRTIPSWAWLQLHIDPARSKSLVRVAAVAASLERLVNESADEFDRRLRSVPGVGVWTSAEVRQRSLGDPDAVSFGDYHVAKNVGWALTGQPFDDQQLADYLEPWKPQRGRVPSLVAMSGLHRPRRGPRMSPRLHLPAHRLGS